MVELRQLVQLVLELLQVAQGDWQLTHWLALRSATSGDGQADTQVELSGMKSGARVRLQAVHVVEVLTQVRQVGLQGSHRIVVVLGTVRPAGQVVRHWWL